MAQPDKDARSEFFERAYGYTPYLGVDTYGGKFIVESGDGGVGRSLFMKGARPEFTALLRAVTAVEFLIGDDAIAGSTFVDVGANIGTTTVPALVLHRFGSAVACEPGPDNFRLLRANVGLNGFDREVRTLSVAVSNRVGTSRFVVVEARGGASWIAVDDAKIEEALANHDRDVAAYNQAHPEAPLPSDAGSPITVVEVELVTVDRLVDTGAIDADRVGMLWIDAEGHEGHILEGAGALAERGVPTVFEFNPEGLDNRGDRGKINEFAARYYTHFIDVRRPEADRERTRFGLREVGELGSYAERFLDSTIPGVFTDLLLVRLDDRQAAAAAGLRRHMELLPSRPVKRRPVRAAT